jgi:hypothetical protein
MDVAKIRSEDEIKMLLWIAILLLVDASLGLLFENRARAFLPGWAIRRIAIAESLLAIICIAIHFRKSIF